MKLGDVHGRLKLSSHFLVFICTGMILYSLICDFLCSQLSVAGHVITVQTLTDHPVGSSPLSNAIELSGHEFLPFVLFCYFDVHKRNERCGISLEHLQLYVQSLFANQLCCCHPIANLDNKVPVVT